MALTASKVPLNVISIGGRNKSCNVFILFIFVVDSAVLLPMELELFSSSSCLPKKKSNSLCTNKDNVDEI